MRVMLDAALLQQQRCLAHSHPSDSTAPCLPLVAGAHALCLTMSAAHAPLIVLASSLASAEPAEICGRSHRLAHRGVLKPSMQPS